MMLFVGLGNIGSAYTNTPHNVGFRALEALRAFFDAEPFHEERKLFANMSRGRWKRSTVLLAQPTTLMNNSGKAVAAIATLRHIPAHNIWVIHDDLDLSLGTLRHSFESRAAGHRGVQSIIDTLGTNAFHRIRIGIGRSTSMPAETYVLRKMIEEELYAIRGAINTLKDAKLEEFLTKTPSS